MLLLQLTVNKSRDHLDDVIVCIVVRFRFYFKLSTLAARGGQQIRLAEFNLHSEV